MERIWYFWKSGPKWTETLSSKDLSHLVPIWPTLGQNLTSLVNGISSFSSLVSGWWNTTFHYKRGDIIVAIPKTNNYFNFLLLFIISFNKIYIDIRSNGHSPESTYVSSWRNFQDWSSLSNTVFPICVAVSCDQPTSQWTPTNDMYINRLSTS